MAEIYAIVLAVNYSHPAEEIHTMFYTAISMKTRDVHLEVHYLFAMPSEQDSHSQQAMWFLRWTYTVSTKTGPSNTTCLKPAYVAQRAKAIGAAVQ